jgi:hypothetical protein
MIKFCLGLEKELKEQLEKEAKEKHETLSSYIRKILYERGK